MLASCDESVKSFRFYLEGELDPAAAARLLEHLRGCRSCRAEFDTQKQVLSILGEAFAGKKISTDFDEAANTRLKSLRETQSGAQDLSAVLIRRPLPPALGIDSESGAIDPVESESRSRLLERLGAAPWWFISLSMHVLVIALAGLVSMSIELPTADDSTIMITELQQRAVPLQTPQKDPAAARDLFDSKRDVVDLDAKSTSDIAVPPDILARAEVGDHFETVNPDLPDTHNALGNPDARMFHSVEGNTEPAGGGGMNGLGSDDIIGIGGAAGRGSGGGFGGGDGTGIGTGSGAGKGSFGNRNGGGRKLMIRKYGGSKATENAVNAALRWLAYHQEADGHWDSKKYGGGGFAGVTQCDTAVTGFAMLAFLGAGHTEKVGEYKDNVLRAVAWMKSKQGPDGKIMDASDIARQSGYSSAIATLAISEAAGMANIKDTREAAQKAVNYCTDVHQEGQGSEKGAWRYNPKTPGDISHVGWFVMALKSAKVAGLHVDPASIDGAIKFLDKDEVKIPGSDTGYGLASRYDYTGAGSETSPRLSAIGMLCRQFLGTKKDDLQASVEWLVKTYGTPVWKDNGTDFTSGFCTDFYHWYYGTLCTFQQGGDIWKNWNEDLKKVLTENQCKDGDDSGSWPVVGTLSTTWGRVGQTALGALCLEVYYRYLKLNADK